MSQGYFLCLREWSCDDLSLRIITCSVPHCALHNTENQTRLPPDPFWNLFWLATKRTFPLLLSSSIYSFQKYMLTTYCVPGIVLDSGVTRVDIVGWPLPWHSLYSRSWRFYKEKDHYEDIWGCMRTYWGAVGAPGRATQPNLKSQGSFPGGWVILAEFWAKGKSGDHTYTKANKIRKYG